MHIGTTSAYAENTEKHWAGQTYCANYLRVRGEYGRHRSFSALQEELPPRTRRIQALDSIECRLGGTTSAYAENTYPAERPRSGIGNYLRVRGEYSVGASQGITPQELPPRTRRIQILGLGRLWLPGTTSAYAENTRRPSHDQLRPRNYLRVRGEYKKGGTAQPRVGELPPRTRRIR